MGMDNAGPEQIRVLGQFTKDKNYTIAEVNGTLCALYGYQNGTYDAKYECQHFGGKLYGIGPKIA